MSASYIGELILYVGGAIGAVVALHSVSAFANKMDERTAEIERLLREILRELRQGSR